MGLFTRGPSRGRLRAWRAAAEACGVDELRPTRRGSSETGWQGRRRAITVTLSSYVAGWPSRGTQVLVDGVADGVWVTRDDGPQSLRKSLGMVVDLAVGDPVFDRHFVVEGRDAMSRAVLSAAGRQWAWAVLNGRLPLSGVVLPAEVDAVGELRNGRLVVALPEGPLALPQPWLPGALRTILDAAEHLAPPPDVAWALARNVRRDPLWQVRLHNLITLVTECPQHPATRDALAAAAVDPSEEIRLRAGVELGVAGVPVLQQLAEGAAFEDFAARAVEGLGPHLSGDTARAILAAALARGRTATVLACLRSLERHGTAGDAAPLIEALSAYVPEVRLGAASALGAVGTADAVLPLQDAARRFGGLMPAAARQAIARIQARLSGATPGQLSLPAAHAGDVSLADPRAGGVALASKPSDDRA
jgi:hypothetical protein